MKHLITIFFSGRISYKYLPLLIALLPGVSAIAQTREITGTVIDALYDEPIPGATILEKGTLNGTITDTEGNYSITVSEGATLVFSYLGMLEEEVLVEASSVIDLTMSQDIVGLEQVVVVGYGTGKKVTQTGSTSTAKGEMLQRSPSTNLTNTLVGQVPGLVGIQRAGEPGNDGTTLRIRGTNTLNTNWEPNGEEENLDWTNEPLVVVDGIPGRGLDRIDPSNIQSVTVLKDASAAIYGSQAANGVILVTTKRGVSGKPVITFNHNQGFQQPTRLPEMADAATYATMLNELAYYRNEEGGRYQTYTEEDIQLYRDGSDPWGHPNTNWSDEVYKKWSTQNNTNISISGGAERIKFYLALGHKFQDGLFKNSGSYYKQYNIRSNIDGQISDNISVGLDLAGRQEIRNYSTRPTWDIIRSVVRGKPNMPAYWPDGTPGPDVEYGDNPVVTSTDATGSDREKVYVLESNLRLNIKIPWIEGLSINSNASYDKQVNFQKIFETPWYLYTWDGNPEHITVRGKRGLESPQLTESMRDGMRINLNTYVTYEKGIMTRHNIKLMVGGERRNGLTDNFEAFRRNYISTESEQLFAGADDEYLSNDGSAEQFALQSYFGRVNYNLDEKYLFEFVWRYDGSSKFAKDSRYGFFPGISAGWRVSEEQFWKDNIAFINSFKLRGSWGQTGNDRIPDYTYMSTYKFNNTRSTVFGGNNNMILDETRIANPVVTWEVATQKNIGIDASFLNQKLRASFDYFHNERSQILIYRNASVTQLSGVNLPPENIGKVENAGFEGVLGYYHQGNDFGFNVSFNGSYSDNKIIFWDEPAGAPAYQQSTGKPVDARLYYNALGIFKDQTEIDAYPHWDGARPGDIKFEDYNGDGVIDANDRVRSDKTSMPKFIGGINIGVNYKQFDIGILIQAATGAQTYFSPESGELGNYYSEYADNRWTPENTSASHPRAWNRDDPYWRSNQNTFWLLNTNYIRLKNFEIGYSLPESLNNKLGISRLRIYLNGLNLVTLDKAKIIDPEMEEYQSYPISKIINCGISLTF